MVSIIAKLLVGPLRSVITTGVLSSVVVQVIVMVCPVWIVVGAERIAIAIMKKESALSLELSVSSEFLMPFSCDICALKNAYWIETMCPSVNPPKSTT